jgi:hypothetical protein
MRPVEPTCAVATAILHQLSGCAQKPVGVVACHHVAICRIVEKVFLGVEVPAPREVTTKPTRVRLAPSPLHHSSRPIPARPSGTRSNEPIPTVRATPERGTASTSYRPGSNGRAVATSVTATRARMKASTFMSRSLQHDCRGCYATFELTGDRLSAKPAVGRPVERGVRRRFSSRVTYLHCPCGGCQSSTLLPSGSMTHPNFPYSESSVFSSTLQPSSRSALRSAARSSTR